MTVFSVICRLHRGKQNPVETANMRGSWAADHGPRPAAQSLLTATPPRTRPKGDSQTVPATPVSRFIYLGGRNWNGVLKNFNSLSFLRSQS